jgi:hypothetical protein
MTQPSSQQRSLAKRRVRFFAKQGARRKAAAARATNPIAAGWTMLAHRAEPNSKIRSLQDRAWTLWQRYETDGWHNFVLRYHNKRSRKFSFWCAWSESQQRFAAHKDLAILHHRHPNLYRWLEAVCRNRWSSE